MSLDIAFHIHPEDGKFTAEGGLIGDEPRIKVMVGHDQEVNIFLWDGDDGEEVILPNLERIEDAVRASRSAYLTFLTAQEAP